MKRPSFLLLLFLFLATPAATRAQEDPAVAGASTEIVPLFFPVLGPLTERLIDSFGDDRFGGGYHQHIGQDLMARKMTPLVAAFPGTVYFNRSDAPEVHNTLTLRGDNGYTAVYMHINNDTPGSKDGLGSRDYAFAPNLRSGMHVIAGQFLGWVGNSGDARGGDPHLHFELRREGTIINSYRSLKQAQRITAPRYSWPAPNEMPGPGEVRLDAVVRTVDVGRQVVAVWAVAYKSAKGKQTIVTRPLQKWLRLTPERVLNVRGGEGEPVRLADLRAGDELTVFLPEKQDAATLKPKRLLAELQPRLPIVIANQNGGSPRVLREGEYIPDATNRSRPVPPLLPEPIVYLAPPADSADRLKDHLNYYRTNRELDPVVREKRLDHVAQSVAEALVQGRLDNRLEIIASDTRRRLLRTEYPVTGLYTDVVAQFDTPEKAVEAWKRQPNDRTGLFDRAITEIGVGYAEGEKPGAGFQRYWVLILSLSTGSNAPAPP